MFTPVLLGLLLPAGAQELDSRLALHDALLDESRGDLARAVQRYSELARTLPEDDPTLVDALYWLGYGAWRLGRADEARQALLEGIRTGACMHCRDLLERIEIEASAVTSVPFRLDFTEGNPALFHPWRVQDRGAIRIDPQPGGRGGNPSLEWTTASRPGDPDRLVLGLRVAAPAPTVLRMLVTTAEVPALIDVVVEDDSGRLFGLASPVSVAVGGKRELTVPLASLLPADGGQGPMLSRLVRLSIVDRTGARAGGVHRMWLDDIELR